MSCVELFYADVSSQERRKPSAMCAQPRCGAPPPSWQRLARCLLNPDRGRTAGASDMVQAWEP
jgi:hypothetical protein